MLQIVRPTGPVPVDGHHRQVQGAVVTGYDGVTEASLDLQPWEEEFGGRINRLFWEYFDRSEDSQGWNRRWVIQRDIAWDQVTAQPIDQNLAGLLESFFAVESFLPDFAAAGLGFYRRLLGLSHNHINWSYEELKHGRLLELLLVRSGARSADQVAAFQRGLFQRVWRPPFETARQMLVYAAYQERATSRNYVQLRQVALTQGAEAAAAGLNYLVRDEAFHHAYFRDVVKLYLEYDEIGTARDLVFVANNFRMPAQHLLPEPRERIRALARNRIVSKRKILDESIRPTIVALGFRDCTELEALAGMSLAL